MSSDPPASISSVLGLQVCTPHSVHTLLLIKRTALFVRRALYHPGELHSSPAPFPLNTDTRSHFLYPHLLLGKKVVVRPSRMTGGKMESEYHITGPGHAGSQESALALSSLHLRLLKDTKDKRGNSILLK